MCLLVMKIHVLALRIEIWNVPLMLNFTFISVVVLLETIAPSSGVSLKIVFKGNLIINDASSISHNNIL